MCNRVAIINKGNLVALDTTKNLLNQLDYKQIKFKVKNYNEEDRINYKNVKFEYTKDYIIASYNKNNFRFDEITEVVKKAEILDISTVDGSLEDIFLKLTKK